MLIVGAADVRAALPMNDAVALMREVFLAVADRRVEQPLRTITTPAAMPGLAVSMPSYVSGDAPVLAVKLVTLFAGNAGLGLPTINGFVAVFDGQTGVPVALVDGAAVTALRTAAASGLAADLLARADSGTVAILGAGVQGRAHLEAMAAVRDVTTVRIWNRTPQRAADLAAWAQAQGYDAAPAATVADATAGADLICVCTGSGEPLLASADVADGAHVCAIGAFTPTTRELTTDLIARALVVVDDRASAWAEAGDVIIPREEGAIAEDHVLADLTALISGAATIPRSPDDVTVFKSVGIPVEDAFTAARVAHIAAARGLGVAVDLAGAASREAGGSEGRQ